MGKFGENFVGALGDGLAGSLTGGLSSLASGLVGSIFAGQAAKRQYKYQLNLMNRQAELNRQAFDYERVANNEDYEKYQSPQAQRAQIEAAGLNAGLMYSGSGTGMSSAIGSQSMNGVGAGSASLAQPSMVFDPVMASDIRLKEAQARNIDADTANKVQDHGQKETLFPYKLEAQKNYNDWTKSQKIGQDLKNDAQALQNFIDTELSSTNIAMAKNQLEQMVENLGILRENLVQEQFETDTQWQKYEFWMQNAQADVAVKMAQVRLHESEITLNGAKTRLTEEQIENAMQENKRLVEETNRIAEEVASMKISNQEKRDTYEARCRALEQEYKMSARKNTIGYLVWSEVKDAASIVGGFFPFSSSSRTTTESINYTTDMLTGESHETGRNVTTVHNKNNRFK